LNATKVEYVEAKEVGRDPHQRYGGQATQPSQKAAADGEDAGTPYANQLEVSYA